MKVTNLCSICNLLSRITEVRKKLKRFDVRSAFGKFVTKQQKMLDTGHAESKYRIQGKSLSGTVEVVAKISPTGKLVIITVYMP